MTVNAVIYWLQTRMRQVRPRAAEQRQVKTGGSGKIKWSRMVGRVRGVGREGGARERRSRVRKWMGRDGEDDAR